MNYGIMELLARLITTVMLFISPIATDPLPQAAPVENTLEICIPHITSNEEGGECLNPFRI